jgi:hypothetical protein
MSERRIEGERKREEERGRERKRREGGGLSTLALFALEDERDGTYVQKR